MGKVVYCPHCHAKMMKYKHTLGSGNLVRGLVILYDAGEGAHNLNDLGLTNYQYTNFHKLKYWGLCQQTGERGEWQMTEYGNAFIQGRSQAYKGVVTYRGETVEYYGDLVTVKTVMPEAYRQRPDYARDAEPVTADDQQSLF